MSSITKHNERWRAHVFVHGTRATKVFDKRRDAQAWAAAKEKELDRTKKSKGMTLKQATTKYLATVSKQKAPSAAAWEARRFGEFMEYMGENTMIADIGSDRISDHRDNRLETVSGSTVIRESNLFRNLFQIAVDEWKLIDANPYKGVKMPEHNPARHQVWTWQLIKRVLRAENRNEREVQCIRAFHIALHTAMRMSEIVGAKVVGKVAVLERDKSSGKASPPVKVPLARKGAALFAKYGPFTIRADIASATFSDMTDELLIDGLTFHDARASALTWLSRRVDVMTLARISRHKNMKILMTTYYRESVEDIANRI
jgi:integrase